MFKGAAARYLISDALSLTGNAIAGVVLPLVLLARTGDVLAAGSLALICAVPQFVCGILGGALLDRVNRKAVCVASDLVSALAVALLPVVDATVGLSFGWFAALGLLGAVGDVPGMTARDALLPEVCEREGVDLQRFVGVSQSLGSLVTIVGPAMAALLIGIMPDVDALWVTAACSCAAAGVSASLPHGVGTVTRTAPGKAGDDPAPHPAVQALLAGVRSVLTDGLAALFANSSLLRASTLLSFGVSMIMASWQGIVLPAYFTQVGTPELTGVFVAAMGTGMLAGSVGYAALAHALSRRTWLTVSLIGMSAGALGMGLLPGTPLLLASAGIVGLFAGPASALLAFFAYDGIADEQRGSALGTLNALYLIVAPFGTFLGSMLIAGFGIEAIGLILAGTWAFVTLAALAAPALRNLDGTCTQNGVQAEQSERA